MTSSVHFAKISQEREASRFVDAENLPLLDSAVVVTAIPLCNGICIELYSQRSWTAIFCQSTHIRPVRKCIIRNCSLMVTMHIACIYLMTYVLSWIKQPYCRWKPLRRAVSTIRWKYSYFMWLRSSQSATLTYKIVRITCINKISWILARFRKLLEYYILQKFMMRFISRKNKWSLT